MRMTYEEQRDLCARKVQLWAKEHGTYSAENQAITAKLMAEQGWRHLNEESFIRRVISTARLDRLGI